MTENCPSCKLNFIDNGNCIACDLCDTWFHFECVSLTPNEFETYLHNNSLPWICPTCENNTHCTKCNIEFNTNSNQKSICCDYCDKFYHLTCTELKITDFNKLANNNETWYCRTCKDIIFPFHSIDNKKLLSCMGIKIKYIKPNPIQNIDPKCKCCSKNVKLNHRKIYCCNCYHFIHKKCTLLKPKDSQNLNWELWECRECHKDKFPLNNIDNDELIMLSFNSNLDCTCTTNHNTSLNNLNTILTSRTDKDFPHNGELNDNYPDLMPNFKYYETHDFHKLKQSTNIKKHTSLLHTNICSLQANIEKLEILLHDLDHKFDIIALSETWNPENKKHMFSPKDLDGYYSYI